MFSFRYFIIEVYQEEKGSTFSDENNEYDINKIFKLTEHINPIEENIKDLEWILDDKPLSKEDQKRRDDSDLSIPILITMKGTKVLVVDGYHRLLKAIQEKHKTILSKWVSKDIMQKAKIN